MTLTHERWQAVTCPLSHQISLLFCSTALSSSEPLYYHAGGYVENVDASFVSGNGQWALDPSAQVVHYALRAGETAATLDAVMPVLETLVSITGCAWWLLV